MSSFSILQALNSAPLYLICGGIIAFVAVICVIFLIRAYRAGIAMGMDKGKMKTVITSSATFSILPSVGILLGVIALSGSLGIPCPCLIVATWNLAYSRLTWKGEELYCQYNKQLKFRI